MQEFKCARCGAMEAVSDVQRGQAIVCFNCNTRQRVPEALAETKPAAVQEPDLGVMDYRGRGMQPPEYTLAYGSAVASTAVGLICLVVGLGALLAGLADRELAMVWGGIGTAASSVLALGIGQGIFCARDAARNSWRPGNGVR